MAKAVLNRLRATELEKSLGSTIYGKNKKVMDEYIGRNLKNGGEFSIPIIQALVDENSHLGKRLIELYDRKIILEDSSMISNEMKILQASVFDGLVVGINMEKGGEMNIYTANTSAIFGIDTESRFTMDKTVELNSQGIVNAVRIDVEYTSDEGFDFKVVNLNKNTNLQIINMDTGKGRFFLVPYIAIQRSMVFFSEMLNDGRTLEVTQEVDGLNKVRYISSKVSELAKYTDSKEFASTLKPEYFPLKGFFYAPLLGATSMTTGRTKIDIIDVSKVAIATKPKIEKPENAINSMLVESSIQKILTEVYNNDEGEYASIIEKLPKKDGNFGDMSDTPSPVTVMKYYHQLRGKDVEKFNNVIPGLKEEMGNVKGVLGEKSEMLNINDYTADDIKSLLKGGVYKFIIRKKDCKYSSMVVTNNEDILKKLYGDDYFAKYESLGTRLYKLESMLSEGKDVDEALRYCGFDRSEDSIESVINIVSTEIPEKSKHERLAEVFKSEEARGKGVRRSSSGDSILVRKCFASLNGTGAVDYYRYLDISKVTSMFRVG